MSHETGEVVTSGQETPEDGTDDGTELDTQQPNGERPEEEVQV